MIIHNYEVRTGHVVSMAKLESGYLKGQLCPEDYDIKQRVGNNSVNFYYANFRWDKSRGPPYERAHLDGYPKRAPDSIVDTLLFFLV